MGRRGVARRDLDFGFSMSALQSSSRYPDQTTALDKVKEWGGTWVRFDLSWSATQPTTSTYNWGQWDTAINNIVARGLKPLLILDYNSTLYDGTGAGTAAESKVGIRTLSNRNAFVAWAEVAVNRYKDRVRCWEIWNEPNSDFFWSGAASELARAQEYTLLVQAVYPAIKAIDPTCTVIAGATSNSPTLLARTFLQNCYASGIQGEFDAWSHHPYSTPNSAISTQGGWTQLAKTGQTPASLREQMVTAGDGAKKIWATEYGAPTGGTGSAEIVTEYSQAEQLTSAIQQWRSYSWAGVLFVHRLRNPRDQYDLTSHEHHFGVLFTNGGTYSDAGKAEWDPKPGAYAFRDAVRGRTGVKSTARSFTGTDKGAAGASVALPANMSVSFWLKQNTQTNTGAARVYDTGTDLVSLATGSTPTMNYNRDYSTTDGVWQLTFANAEEPDYLNYWHHICWVHTDGSTPKVYVNGVERTVTVSVAPVGTIVTTAKTFTVGNRGGGDRAIEGSIANLIFWDHALTVQEVLNSMSDNPLQNTGELSGWRMLGASPEVNVVGGGASLTLTGTSVVDGPKLYPARTA